MSPCDLVAKRLVPSIRFPILPEATNALAQSLGSRCEPLQPNIGNLGTRLLQASAASETWNPIVLLNPDRLLVVPLSVFRPKKLTFRVLAWFPLLLRCSVHRLKVLMLILIAFRAKLDEQALTVVRFYLVPLGPLLPQL